MFFKVAIAIGAGLASALLFFIPVKGTTAAMVLALLGPLPIMIAGLGFGARVGFAAAAAGVIAISLALDPLLGAFFAASLGLPAFWLARLAAQTVEVADPQSGQPLTIPAYSTGKLLAWIATLSAASAMLPALVLAVRFPTIAEGLDETARQLAPIVRRLLGGEQNMPYSMSAPEFARVVVLAMPALIAAWSVVTLSLNLWLAGKVARKSGLPTPRQDDLPLSLRLPRDSLIVLAASIVACALGETPRFVASPLAAAFLMAYALHGMAVVHGFLRANPLRSALLFGVYALIFMTAWPLLLAVAIGIFDSLIHIKRHPAPQAPAA
jgi:hypothetical protein